MNYHVPSTRQQVLYEVNVKSLATTELFADWQAQGGEKPEGRRVADLRDYHGKGVYSGQGVLVYSNNGEKSQKALSAPRIPSGVLAEWDGKSDTWHIEPAAGRSFYRLPKFSHSYDAAHGWNTEWPRIREISENSISS